MGNNSRVKSLTMSMLYYILIGGAIIYAGMNAYLYFCQRSILYLPVKEMAGPTNYGIYNAQLINIKTSDNVNIIGWYVPPKHNQPVMLYLHGNAGNLGDRVEKLQAYLGQGFGLLAISWRGYGPSDGSPTEDGLYNDARAGLKYLTDNGVNLKDIFFYGESLGSGVAVQMATEFAAKALVLEAPYTSIASKAADLYPYIPVRLLLKDHFSSIDKISSVHIPVLIFHGYLDQVMPISHGRRMLAAANEPKEARFFEHVGHTDFNFGETARITHEFVMGIK